MSAPPAGGFGSKAPLAPELGRTKNPYPRRSPLHTLFPILGSLALAGGGLTVLARHHVERSRTAEARIHLREIANLAEASYKRDGQFCPSANAVPKELSRSDFYQSAKNDWQSYECLGFHLDAPQWFQYRYESTGNTFRAIAVGYVGENHEERILMATGKIDAGTVVLDVPDAP
jgi:hypothetical protein